MIYRVSLHFIDYVLIYQKACLILIFYPFPFVLDFLYDAAELLVVKSSQPHTKLETYFYHIEQIHATNRIAYKNCTLFEALDS